MSEAITYGLQELLPRVLEVTALPDYNLLLLFTNGEKKVFDMKPYLKQSSYQSLNQKSLFKQVKVEFGSVVWQNNLDFCPDTLYLKGTSFQAN